MGYIVLCYGLLPAHEFGLSYLNVGGMYTCIMLQTVYTYQLCIWGTDHPGHYTVVGIIVQAKTTVMKQLDRTFQQSSLPQIWRWNEAPLQHFTQRCIYLITVGSLVHAKNKICFKSSASPHYSISPGTIMFFSVIMNWTSVVVFVYWVSVNV